jgi:hypothetical protein
MQRGGKQQVKSCEMVVQTCSETSLVFIIRPTAQRYGGLVIISGLIVSFGEQEQSWVKSRYHE